mmetsp:Transcript_26476/g.36569  ORF Transcript_26476/g.36569 Transcript_26476/m.36569 type:complete len:207 (-) Transcript_26476:346-966(-)
MACKPDSGIGSSSWHLCKSSNTAYNARVTLGSSSSSIARTASTCFFLFSAPAALSIMSAWLVGIRTRFSLSSRRRFSSLASCCVTGFTASMRPISSSTASSWAIVRSLAVACLHVFLQEGCAATSSHKLSSHVRASLRKSCSPPALISASLATSESSLDMAASEIQPASPSSGSAIRWWSGIFSSFQVTLKVLYTVSRCWARSSQV